MNFAKQISISFYKFLIISVFVGIFLNSNIAFASITDGTIDSVRKYAWGENIGWVNFGCSTCNVRITDSGLTGYAWSPNYGWINLNPTTAGVKNDGEGILSGHAWGENLGWINFSGVIINSVGRFTGLASGTISGRINFDCINCAVITNWRPKSARPAPPPLVPTYTISLSVFPENSGTISGAGRFSQGASVTVSALANKGYRFLHWREGNAIVSATTHYSFTITRNHSLTAVFQKIDYVVLNLDPKLRVIEKATQDDLTIIRKTREVISLIKKQRIIIAQIDLFFDKDLEWQEVITDSKENKSFLHIPDRKKAGVRQSILYIPAIKNTGRVYICPGAKTLAAVHEQCPGIYYLELKPIEGYYRVSIENTGGAEADWPIEPELVIRSATDITHNSAVLQGELLQIGKHSLQAFFRYREQGKEWLQTEKQGLTKTGIFSQKIINLKPETSYQFYSIIQWLNKEKTSSTLGLKTLKEPIIKPEPIPELGVEPVIPVVPTVPIGPEPIIPAVVIPAVVVETVQKIEEAITEIREKAKQALQAPPVQKTTQTVVTAGAVAGAAVVTSSVLVNPLALTEVLMLPIRLWSLLLIALGIKKKRRPWGTVYDSVTKQPLDPAYVVLEDLKGKEIADSFTDLDGRYGFLVSPGEYILKANKTNYSFPSEKLKQRKEDELYTNLYFGEQVQIIKAGEVITKNIPLDPIKFDWNEFAKKEKKLMKFHSKIDRFLAGRLINTIFYIGFIVTLLVFLVTFDLINGILLTLYLLILILRELGFKPKALGRIYEKETKTPLSFAILRVYLQDRSKEIFQRVTDKLGRYYCLLPPGQYLLTIERKELDGSYTEIQEKQVNAKKGIINLDFAV